MNNKELNTAFTKLLSEVDGLKKDLSDYKADFSQEKTNLKNQTDTQSEEFGTITSNIEFEKKKLDEYFKTLFDEDNGYEKHLNDLRREVNEYAKKLLKGDDEELSISEKINEISRTILEYKKEIFGYEDEAGEKKGIKHDIEKLISDGRANLEKNKSDYNLLKNKVESLLPQAAAAGLAYDYNQAKQDYGLRLKVEEDKDGNKIQKIDWYQTAIHSIFPYLIFIGPLCGLMVLVFIAVNNNFSLDDFVKRFFIFIPFLWLSVFGQKTISIRRRLYEEYNHKEKVVKLFLGLKKELSKEKIEELESIVLATVKKNPAKILEKGETVIDKALNQVKELRLESLTKDFRKMISKSGNEKI